MIKGFSPSTQRIGQVEADARILMQRMKIREPMTMRQLTERYCEFTGAVVLFQEKLLPVDCFFAICLKVAVTPATYVIAYQSATSAWHQDYGIGHELGHIIAGHYDRPNALHHSAMASEDEWEAEYTASLLSRWAYQSGRALDRRKALRPLENREDMSLPLQDRVGWL